MIKRYGASVSPCSTPATMSKYSVSPSGDRTFTLVFLSVSIYLSIYLSILIYCYLCIYLSMPLCFYLSIYLSILIYCYLSIDLSILICAITFYLRLIFFQWFLLIIQFFLFSFYCILINLLFAFSLLLCVCVVTKGIFLLSHITFALFLFLSPTFVSLIPILSVYLILCIIYLSIYQSYTHTHI